MQAGSPFSKQGSVRHPIWYKNSAMTCSMNSS
jgi:hypothetical protein